MTYSVTVPAEMVRSRAIRAVICLVSVLWLSFLQTPAPGQPTLTGRGETAIVASHSQISLCENLGALLEDADEMVSSEPTGRRAEWQLSESRPASSRFTAPIARVTVSPPLRV